MKAITYRVAERFLAGSRLKSAPSKVDKYYEEVKDGNPDYSEEKAWATAWSIYCKYKDPGSESCHQDEYFKRR